MNLLNIGKDIASPIEAIGNVFDKLFTSDEEREKAKFVLEKLRQRPAELQAEINKIEAQHRSIWVAGWRPAVGWVCAFGMFYRFVGNELAKWFCAMWFPNIVVPELTGSGDLITILLALLGMSGIRTFEKINKISK